MPLADGYEWSTSARFPDEWCVRRAGENYMLCGRVFMYGQQRGFTPAFQPEHPDGIHHRCASLAAGRRGVCPVCGGDIALDGRRRLLEHGVWVVTRDGPEPSDEPCPGAGQVPEAGS